MTPSFDRYSDADFSAPVYEDQLGLLVQPPTRARMSVQNHLNEFDTQLWLVVAVSFVIIIACIFFILANNNETLPALSASTAVAAKAFAGKGGWINEKRFSVRIATLTASFLGLMLFIAYCSFLNGFLTVVSKSFSVRGEEDILDYTAGLTQWASGIIATHLANFPQGSVQ